VHLVGFIVRNL